MRSPLLLGSVMLRRHFFHLGTLLVVVMAAGGAFAEASIPQVDGAATPEADGPEEKPAAEVEREGIVVALELEDLDGDGVLREADDVLVRVHVTDSNTGTPLTGLYPAAWMAALESDETNDQKGCQQKVEEFVGGSILYQPELDLNVYYVLALNDDSTISVVDPLFGFGGTKLLAMIGLPSPGEDWVLGPDETRLYVTAPEAGKLVIADTTNWTRRNVVDVGERPGALAMQTDGGYLWVAVEDGVVAFDVRTEAVAKRIPTGPGPHALVLAEDDRRLVVANGGGNTVSVIDTGSLEEIARLETGKGPISLDWSSLARAVYVSHHGTGTVVAVAADEPRVLRRIEAEPGLGQLRFAPEGRLAMVVHPELDLLHIIDAAQGEIIQTGDMKSGPDQIAFSDELAYVRHRDSEIILMIPLDEIGEKGAPVPVVDFPGGQEPFKHGGPPIPAPAIVQAPGATAVLVANPGDRMIYYYKEGMAAPMGGFRNYDRQPRAVLVVDRSLQERRRGGVYETAAKMRRPGRYQVAVFVDTPRIVHCFETEILPDPELERQRLAERPAEVELIGEVPSARVGEPFRLRFRLLDPPTGKPVAGAADVQTLAVTGGNWQQRRAASETEPGVYEVALEFPEPGVYTVAVESRSQRLKFFQSPQIRIRVRAEERVEAGSP